MRANNNNIRRTKVIPEWAKKRDEMLMKPDMLLCGFHAPFGVELSSEKSGKALMIQPDSPIQRDCDEMKYRCRAAEHITARPHVA